MDLPQEFVLNANEDDGLRYLVTRILEREGFWVREAKTGDETLRLAREGAQLVVLDVRLEDQSGLEVCRRLKATPETEAIPVLQTSSASLSARDMVQGLENGADGYLAQPVEPLELLATAHALIRARRAEEAVRQAAQDWQRTFDALGDAVAVASGDGQVLRQNPAMRRLLGLTEDDLVLATQRLAAVMPGLLQAASARLGPRIHNVHAVKVQGRHFRCVLDPIPSELATLDRWVVVLSDVTDQLQRQDEHRRRADELSREAERKDEFLAMLAHELRNPLHAISTALQLQDRLPSEHPQMTQVRQGVQRQVSHLSRLVDDLLDVSRITRGKISLQRQPVDLRNLVSNAVDVGRSKAQERQQRVVLQIPPPPVPVRVDPLRVEQTLINLLTNATRYSPEESDIEVTLTSDKGRDAESALIEVRDYGQGIPSEALTQIFELFTQGDRSLERSGGGLGIGLTVARSLVQLHGGQIWAQSDGVGMGSSFYIELPVDLSVIEELRPPREEPATDTVEKLRIVVVEDNHDAALALKGLLASMGHEVEVAHDGHTGLRLARTESVDLALVDIGLPGLDGFEIAEALADEPRARPTLVAVTGYGQPRDRERALSSGFDDYLIKPVGLKELETIIRRIRRASPAA